MANAKKCDRCGKYYDAVDRTMYLFIGKPAYNNVTDLCDRCNDELERWYNKDLGDISDVERFDQ